MTTHISDELPRLLTGDATRDVVLAAAEHLRSCPDCQQELVSAVIAHASLTSAHRFAPEIVTSDSVEHEDVDTDTGGELVALPDMSGVFAEARNDADAAAVRAARRPRRRQLLVAAAAAVVLAGGGVAIGEAVTSGSSPSRTVALGAYDVGSQSGKATLSGNKLTLDATSLPNLDKSHRYEVWLTDPSRKSMQSVGYIGDDETADLQVPTNVISHYNDIEVSVQRLGQTRYSGVSVLRGSYG